MNAKPTPLFSIITVTLNCSDAITKTVQSVLDQDFHDFEYIVKDGGSSDNTVSQVRALGVSNIQITPDNGVYEAMNQAVSLAHGDYVYFLNGGDRFASSHVLSDVAWYVQEFPGAGLLYGDIVTRRDRTLLNFRNWGRAKVRIAYPAKLRRLYLFRQLVCHQAWFVRRELYEQFPFDLRYTIMADHDFLLKFIFDLNLPYRRIPVLIAEYESGGISDRLKERKRRERKQILTKHFGKAEFAVLEGVRILAHALLALMHGWYHDWSEKDEWREDPDDFARARPPSKHRW